MGIIDVTKYAKSIFGDDIVLEAYIDITNLGGRVIKADNNSIMPEDACPLEITFKNGNKVEIWASEWGGCCRI